MKYLSRDIFHSSQTTPPHCDYQVKAALPLGHLLDEEHGVGDLLGVLIA
jgi:hypothetical protein